MIDIEDLKSRFQELNELEDFLDFQKPSENSLYHYTNIDALKSIIHDRKIYISNAMFLNDKFEVFHLRELIKEVALKMRKVLDQTFFDYLEKIFDDAVYDICKNTFILSFGLKNDSLTMWNGYGKNDGYCLTLKYDELLNILGDYTNQLGSISKVKMIYRSVIYKDDLKKKLLTPYLELLHEIDERSGERCVEELITLTKRILANILVIGYLSKKECFSDEREFRFVFLLDNFSKDLIKFRTSKGVVIPYIEIPIVKNGTELLPVKEITIGPKINIDIASEGIKCFMKKEGYLEDDIIKLSNIPLRY